MVRTKGSKNSRILNIFESNNGKTQTKRNHILSTLNPLININTFCDSKLNTIKHIQLRRQGNIIPYTSLVFDANTCPHRLVQKYGEIQLPLVAHPHSVADMILNTTTTVRVRKHIKESLVLIHKAKSGLEFIHRDKHSNITG